MPVRRTYRVVVAMVLLIGGVGVSHGGDGQTVNYPNPEVARLNMFRGPWSVTQHHYDAQGERIGTVKGKEENAWILDDHAIQRSYKTGKKPRVYRALGTLTWNSAAGEYQGVWFDNISTTGPTTVKGDWNEETRTFTLAVQSRTKDGSPVTHEVSERFLDEETRVATTFLVDGDKRTKLLEVHYKRAVPCPGNMRGLSLIPED